jgi:Fe-S-cluster containining protein
MINIGQIIPEGYCLECPGCCRFAQERSAWAVRISSEEQQALGIQDTIVPAQKNAAAGQFVCSFFDIKSARCTVYYKRPLECRLYPFVINRKGNAVFLAIDLNCPFARDHYETQSMRDFILSLSAACGSAGFLQYLNENPWLIQQYPDVLNVAALTK